MIRDDRRIGKILVVDDEDGIRLFASRTLARAGYEVVEADDGRPAVEIFREQGDAIDLVLLDLTMKEMGGAEVIEELQRLRKDITVIVSSGHSERDLDPGMMQSGRVHFLQKPYSSAKLLAIVRDIRQSQCHRK